MAVNGVAFAHGSTTHPARVFRNLPAAMFGLPMATHANAVAATTRGGAYGVVGDGDFVVTGTGGLGYSVAAGRVVLPGTSATAQGAMVGYNDAAVTGNLDAHSAFIRHDFLAYRVRDTDEDATGAEDDAIVVIKGVSASTDPAIPASLGSLKILSRAVIPATSGTPTFTDLRMFAAAIGGVYRCTSTTRPTSTALYEGLEIWERDTDRRLEWNGSAWQIVHEPVQTATPTLTNVTLGAGGVNTQHYSRRRGWLDVTGVLQLGTGGSITGDLGIAAPAANGVAIAVFGKGDAVQGSNGFDISSLIAGSASTFGFRRRTGTGLGTVNATTPFTWASGNALQYSLSYPIA